MDVTEAGDRWRAMIGEEREQSLRLRDNGWEPPADAFAAHVASFRADPRRSDDPVLATLRSLAEPWDVVADIGAGAGRYALPLALRVQEVIAVEPSPSMAEELVAGAERAGIGNIRLLRASWQEAPNLHANLAFAAHVGYTERRIEDLVAVLRRSASRWAAMVVFAKPAQYRFFPFWPAVHGEDRSPLPYLPQLIDVLDSLGIRSEVTIVSDVAWPLGPRSLAHEKLRRRLFLVPGSAADQRLEAAMAVLLDDWGDGALGPRDHRPLDIGVVRWRPEGYRRST